MSQKQSPVPFEDLCAIARGPYFQENIRRFEKSSFYQKFIKGLYSHEVSIDKENISYRVLNHWDEENLLECSRDSEKGWRKFNLIEGMWVFIIQALRKFGLSFDSLETVKKCIFHETTSRSATILVEYYLARILALSKPVYLTVCPDGSSGLLEYSEYTNALALQYAEQHIVLNLNEILTKMRINRAGKIIFPLEAELSPELYRIFEILQEEDFEYATIRKKGGVIDRIETTSVRDLNEKVSEMLQNDDNQDIMIKKRDGRIIFVTSTTLEKV